MDARNETLLAAIEDIGANSIKHLYDFGDGWTHTVKIEKIIPATPGFDDLFLFEHVGRCPLNDVGGPWGYEEFREALANDNHVRHNELLDGWGNAHCDPRDVDATNLRKIVDGLAAKCKRIPDTAVLGECLPPISSQQPLRQLL
ncbi:MULTISPECIES: plasmid pRiA4b ORF-3 family protein [Agrobacterium]|uniref:plasmid pRiA4b ORF-3 family protein n=1 Tax=Agrobacterium TaxID=357 RepID=UPI001572E096|nr:plasmid pRiA4b ORF-3 family protein [Agrobacterium sp. InxBP2]MCW8280039.1 plasmid pRiA4b ORF-3 family protein [Agrobacterium sp. InxBP2]NTE45025.1 plasmid pRiA4b ORF-3 family protein [Agrobacterium pusense]